MLNKTTPNKPKEKKQDNRQMLLDLIAMKYGPVAMDTMEQGFKNKDKQIKQAMIEQGMTVEQLGQTQGIDLSSLAGPQTENKPSYTEVAPTSPFALGGIEVGEGGSITQKKPGLLGKILGTEQNQRAQLENALLLQKLIMGGQGLEAQAEQRRQGQEERRLAQNKAYNLRNFGGVVRSQDMEDPEYGLDLNSMVEAYGIPARVDPKTGERIYQIPPEAILKKRAEQMPIREKELEFFNDTFDAIDTANEIKSGLEELGVQDPTKFGQIQTENINSELGPFSIPAKFNLAGQYAKDPKYTALKSKLERLFQKYRKIITGAQASYAELKVLRPLVASFSQRPGVFFSTVEDMNSEANRMLETRLESMESVGRDVKGLRSVVEKRSGGRKEKEQGTDEYQKYLDLIGGQ